MSNFPKLHSISWIFIFSTFAIFQYIQNCFSGCLSCDNQTAKCRICDGFNDFKLSGGVCVQSLTENCKLVSSLGSCLICQNGYSLSGTICRETFSAKENNCSVYEATPSCEYKPTFVFYADMIYKTQNIQIMNCAKMDTFSKCIRCMDGFTLASNSMSCDKISTILPYCKHYIELVCTGCQNDYIYSKNGFILQLKQPTFLPDKFVKSLYDVFFSYGQVDIINCLSQNDQNCISYSESIRCIKCANGYFLNFNNICVLIPNPSIQNCSVYNYDLTCKQCINGYYLQTLYRCVLIEPIKNCILYDGSASFSKCLQCSKSYYLSSFDSVKNYCIMRKTSLKMPNCENLTLSNETCDKCLQNYTLSLNKTNCVEQIPNCAQNKFNGEMLTCLKCQNGYYLNDSICVAGNVNNCIEQIANICIRCENGYFLSNSSCVYNLNLMIAENCLTMSSFDQHSCEACDLNSDRFLIINPCFKVPKIVPFCVLYDSLNQCQKCSSGYYLNSANICVIYTGDVSCQKYDTLSTNCLICSDEYFLKNGFCYPIFDILTQNCDSIVQNNSLSCTNCSINSTPILLSGVFQICLSPHLNNTALIAILVDNCLNYNEDQSCMTCKNNYFLDPVSKICMSSCANGVLLHDYQPINNIFLVTSKNVCLTIDPIPNCQFYAPNYQYSTSPGVPKNGCIQCKPGFIATWPFATGQAHFYDKITSSSDFAFRLPMITSCQSLGIVLQNNFIPRVNLLNCNTVIPDLSTSTAKTYYGCFRCNIGYSGVPVKNDTVFYLPSCVSIPNCLSNIVYSGLSFLTEQISSNPLIFPNIPFSSLVSCYACSGANFIPVFTATETTYTYSGITVLMNQHVAFNFSFSPPSLVGSSTNNTLLQTSCMSNNDIKNLDPANKFPDFCGMAMILPNRVLTLYDSDSTTSIICVACAPGFSATLLSFPFTVLTYAIASCNYIQNCLNSTRFNGCSVCQPGFAFEFDSIKQIPLIDSCISAPNNCSYVYSNGTCAICSHGYLLHLNGFCYTSDFPFCAISKQKTLWSFFKNNLVQPIKVDFFMTFSGQHLLGGCEECNINFVKYSARFSQQMACMRNPTLSTNLFKNMTFPNLINFCLKFSFSGLTIICMNCSHGYVLSADNKTCFAFSYLLQNCKIALNSTFCQTCVDFYYFDVLMKVCVRGSINDCLSYSSSKVCLICANNSVLYQNLCYKLPNVNCLSFDLSQANNGVLICNQCIPVHYNFDSNFAGKSLQLCLKFTNIIANCSQISRSNITDLTCSLCNKGYYFSPDMKSCIKNSVYVNCTLYSQFSDICIQCISGYYVSKDLISCVLIPTGLYRCIDYKNEYYCKICDEETYLINGTCIDLPFNAIILNCQLYIFDDIKNEIICSTCKTGYQKFDSAVCEKLLKINCLAYFSPVACSSCPDGYILSRNWMLVACESMYTPFCSLYEKIDENMIFCIQCENGFYLSEKKTCIQVMNIISGCLIYSSLTTCKICNRGYFLTSDKNKCQAIFLKRTNSPESCFSGFFTIKAQCGICEPAYYLDKDGVCVRCLTEQGCFFCDPNEPFVCLFCAPGYYQNIELRCIPMVG